ncbi:MAG: peptide chain release factor-like protein [Planctomycetota bacterium]
MPRYTTDLDKLAREVELAFYRASGPGGQHRNKVETAVRMVHPPSGITVRCAETQEDDGEPFEAKMKRLIAQLRDQQSEAAKLDKEIVKNLRGLGFWKEAP